MNPENIKIGDEIIVQIPITVQEVFISTVKGKIARGNYMYDDSIAVFHDDVVESKTSRPIEVGEVVRTSTDQTERPYQIKAIVEDMVWIERETRGQPERYFWPLTNCYRA